MRIFAKPNLMTGWKCPVCGTAEESEVVLIGIAGTQKDNLCEAEQFHLKCLDLWYYPEIRIVAMRFGEKGGA